MSHQDSTSQPSSSKIESKLDCTNFEGNSSKKCKLDELEKVEHAEEKNSFIKKPRPISMSTDSDSNNNTTVKQVATNITYQKSNVSRQERLNVNFKKHAYKR